jgi:hypothetical protein
MRALLPCLFVLAGCATPSLALPGAFQRLKNESDFTAVTADDARIWVREFEDPDEARLEFWSEVLKTTCRWSLRRNRRGGEWPGSGLRRCSRRADGDDYLVGV